MPKTMINRVILAVMAIASVLVTVDALLGDGSQHLILGVLCLAITAATAPSLRRIEEKRTAR